MEIEIPPAAKILPSGLNANAIIPLSSKSSVQTHSASKSNRDGEEHPGINATNANHHIARMNDS